MRPYLPAILFSLTIVPFNLNAATLDSSGSQAVDYNLQTIKTASVTDIKKWLKKDAKGCFSLSQFRILYAKPFSLRELTELFGKKPIPSTMPTWTLDMRVWIVDDTTPNTPRPSDFICYPYAILSRREGDQNKYYLSVSHSDVLESEIKN